jgi:hypothetical protein
VKPVSTGALRDGTSQSCGCLRRELQTIRAKHGGTKSSEHNIWLGIYQRCFNENHPAYHSYGGRGITVCERWRDANGFANFLADMGRRPSPKHSIDRKNNDGNYEPDNCRWATSKEQCNNNRRNIRYEIDGVVKTLKQWAETFDVPYKLLWKRTRKLGWNIKTAIETPPDKDHKNPTQQRLVTFEGRTQSVTDWAAELGMSRVTLYARLDKGWTLDRVLSR